MSLLTIIFILPILLSPFPLLAASTHQGLIQVGYWYYETEIPVTDINSTLFTHLICAFADINPSTYQLSIPSSSFLSFSNNTKSKNPSLLTLLSIGGGSSNYTILSTMISNPSYRKAFIGSSLATARRYGFDGLDFSWSSAHTSTQMTNMATLFKEWRDAINNETNTNSTTQSSSNSNPLILTMKAHFKPTLDTATLPIDSIITNMDWVHVLTYNYHNPTDEHFTNGHSVLYDPFSQSNSNFGIKEWISGGLSADKLVLGLPFYGYAWKLADPDKHYIGAPSIGPAYKKDRSTMSYKQIKAYIDPYKANAEYNSTYVQNYCYSGTTWIGYDGTESVTAKVSYVKDQGLLGYHIWHISQDDNWALSQVAAQAVGVSGDGDETKSRGKRMLAIILPTSAAGIVLLLGFIFCYCYLERRQGSGGKGRDEKGRVKTSRTKNEGFNSLETYADGLRAFSLRVIKESTDNFALCNKLGEGGYGPVYKGKLEDGQVIAVKRLSNTSEQGVEEFENEVTLLARLQHVNLVRILGFSTEGGEKMLIYEYMPNGSLDSYLFHPVRRLLLDWRKRVQIVEGVIQGLLYLQEYSRLSIIHRDIKPGNVLLDIAMTPKIADFGMARIFQKNDPEANTEKIVGTRGYVPPEYATTGAYSVKLDVYSFGVLLLQMISGKKTTRTQAVTVQAYEKWKEGKEKEFMDPTLDDTNSTCSMATCLQVALLCVQDNPKDRPTMLEVSSMINSDIKDLPIPSIPAFSVRRGSERHTESCQSGYTVNEATISEMIPRFPLQFSRRNYRVCKSFGLLDLIKS